MVGKGISISELSSSGITRTSAAASYDVLADYMSMHGDVEIDLTEDRPLSLSFLDELVRRLAESGELDRATFLVGDVAVGRKLSRVAAMRRVDLRYRLAHDPTIRKVQEWEGP